ncbi:MAG: hypothetical protein ACFCUX_09710 [Candidatus Methylacidiphilales bacterium]
MKIPHAEHILKVHDSFSKFDRAFAFCGGSIAPLLYDTPARYTFRPTQDIDLMVLVNTDREYSKIEEELRNEGFCHDIHGPLCRWCYEGIVIDVMPTQGSLMGISTVWFEESVNTSQLLPLNGQLIPVITASGFIACKFEAFRDRGNGDYYMSHDIEDIVAVIDHRKSLPVELNNSEDPLATPAQKVINHIVRHPDFENIIAAHIPPDPGNRARINNIIAHFRSMTSPND